MKKAMMKQKTCICTLLLFLISCAFGFFMTSANYINAEQSIITVDQVTTFTMQDGAAVRLEENHNGLRFISTMTEDEYAKLKNNTDYKQLIFGIVVAPADYMTTYGRFDKATLFGVDGDKVYDWAEWNGSEWVYNGNKTRIININATSLNTQRVAGKAIMSASITDLDDNNIPRDFIARGYIKAIKTDDSEVYALADYFNGDASNNTRSMALVAERAVVAEGADAPSDTDKSWLINNYLNKSGVSIDSTANTFALNNYDSTNGIDISSMGTVKYVTDGVGNLFDFSINEDKLFINLEDKTADETLYLTLYTLNNGRYNLNKIKVSFDYKTPIYNETDFLAIRSADSGDYVLMNDIVLTSDLSAPGGTFGGSLDGNGKTISGVVVGQNFGLFSTVSADTVIKNIYIKDAKSSGMTGILTDNLNAGATIDNVFISASIGGTYSGGIARLVNGSETETTKVTNCIVNITNSTLPETNGLLFGFGSAKANVDLTGTYGISTSSGAKLVGNRSGDSENAEKYVAFRDKVNALNTETSPKAFSSIPNFFGAVTLKDNAVIEALGYTIVYIDSIDAFNAMRAEDGSKKYYILTTDITLTSTALAAPATDFYGILDGNGYSIKNMTLNDTSKGLFQNLRYVVKNLALVDVNITGQAGGLCYDATSTAIIENVYVSISNLGKEGSAGLAKNMNNSSTVVRNCVVYVKAAANTTKYTRTYSDSTTFVGRKMGMLYYSGITSVNASNMFFISDLTDLQCINISATKTYTESEETEAVLLTKSFLTNNPVRKVDDFRKDISAGTVTVKDSELLSKII